MARIFECDIQQPLLVSLCVPCLPIVILRNGFPLSCQRLDGNRRVEPAGYAGKRRSNLRGDLNHCAAESGHRA
jgi:hypothetical protein